MELINNKYQKLSKLGEGSFAKVFLAMDSHPQKDKQSNKIESNENLNPNMKQQQTEPEQEEKKKENPIKNTTSQYYAIKKLKSLMYQKSLKQYGEYKNLPEISIISSIQHANIINIVDMFEYKSNFYIVQPFCCCDLSYLLKKHHKSLTYQDRQQIMLQILQGVAELHKNNILHRDLKPSNLLITQEGMIKIADFSISKYLKQSQKPMTKNMVTRFYRPPEIIYGETNYGLEVDIWSLGCLFAEIISGTPLFPGASDIDQLDKIFSLLGSATVLLKYFFKNQFFELIQQKKKKQGRQLARLHAITVFLAVLRLRGQGVEDSTINSYQVISQAIPEITYLEENLLKKMLVLNPKKRYKVDQLFGDDFMKEALEQANLNQQGNYFKIVGDLHQLKIESNNDNKSK